MSSLKHNFKKFVAEIVDDWMKKYGIGGEISNVAKGANAVDYLITNRVPKLTPRYFVEKSKASKTPSDIYLLAPIKNDGKKLWHLMLVQVKSKEKGKSYASIDKKEFYQFAKEDVQEKIQKSEHSIDFKNDSVIISIGYANIKKNIYHKLEKAEMYEDRFIIYNDSGTIEMKKILPNIINAHKLE